jgi:hypothetical protein
LEAYLTKEKETTKQQGADLFVVDNSDADWKVSRYLKEWTDFASTFDVATGYFEIGALLALDGQWQKLDKLRILMGEDIAEELNFHLSDRFSPALIFLCTTLGVVFHKEGSELFIHDPSPRWPWRDPGKAARVAALSACRAYPRTFRLRG